MHLFHKKPPVNHTLDYFILIIILSLTAIAVKFLNLTDSLLMTSTIFVSLGYIFWGITHHKKAGHIDQKILYEYVGLALLVNILIYILIS